MSEPTPTPQKPRRPLWHRLLKWTVRVVVVLVLLVIATYAIASYWAATTIQSEIAKIRAAHQPVTFAELDALAPKVDPDQDAGPCYIAAIALTERPYNDANYEAIVSNSILTNPKVTPEVRVWAQKALDKNQLAVDMLDRGTPLAGCSTDVQLQNGIAVVLPRLGQARGLLDVNSIRTRMLALQGQGDSAVDALIASLNLARIFERQPILIGTLVQWGFMEKISSDAAVIFSYSHPSDASLQKLADALTKTPPIRLDRTLIAERVYALKVLQDVIGNRPPESAADLPLPEGQTQGRLGVVGRIMTAQALPDYARMIQATNPDWPIAGPALQAIAAEPKSLLNLWMSILRPSMGVVAISGQRAASFHRCTLAAVEIERYRRAHNNQLPNTLADLPNAAGLPKDPFNGQSLSYQKTPDSYYLYSSNQPAPTATGPAKPADYFHDGGLQIRIAP